MTDDFAVEVTSEGIGLTRDAVEGLSIKTVEGMCAADPTTVSLESELLREAREEMKIEEQEVSKIIPAGAYLHPNRGDMDFAYLLLIDLSEGELRNRLNKAYPGKEHRKVVSVTSHEQVQRLLEEGRVEGYDKKAQIMYSTRGALQSLRPGELAA